MKDDQVKSDKAKFSLYLKKMTRTKKEKGS